MSLGRPFESNELHSGNFEGFKQKFELLLGIILTNISYEDQLEAQPLEQFCDWERSAYMQECFEAQRFYDVSTLSTSTRQNRENKYPVSVGELEWRNPIEILENLIVTSLSQKLNKEVQRESGLYAYIKNRDKFDDVLLSLMMFSVIESLKSNADYDKTVSRSKTIKKEIVTVFNERRNIVQRLDPNFETEKTTRVRDLCNQDLNLWSSYIKSHLTQATHNAKAISKELTQRIKSSSDRS